MDMLGGHWAVIPIFRSTLSEDVLKAWRRFDKAETRRQVDTEKYRHRAIAWWLFRSGYTYPEIARGHYGLEWEVPLADRARAWRRAAPDHADRQHADRARQVDKVRQEITRTTATRNRESVGLCSISATPSGAGSPSSSAA